MYINDKTYAIFMYYYSITNKVMQVVAFATC